MPPSKKASAKASSRSRRKLWLLAIIPAVLVVLGVATVASFELKRIDTDYFSEE